MINLELLNQFLCVAKYLNFTKAADALYISHSTVSRNISRLESELGTPLLLRDSRTVSLTPAGKHLARRGKELMQNMEQVEQEIQRFNQEITPRLHIASFNFFNHAVFRAYQQFHKANPLVDMSIRYLSLATIPDAIDQEEVDLGITFSFSLHDASKYEIMPILDGEFVLLVSADHPLAELHSVDIRDPRLEHPIMISSMENPFVSSIGRDAVFQPSRLQFCKADSIDSIILQVKAGMGCALLPEHAVTQIGSGCSAISLDGVDSSYQVVLFWKKNNTSSVLKSFLNQIKNSNTQEAQGAVSR